MSEGVNEINNVSAKFKSLDSELNTFLKTIKEIKDIRENVGSLPEKLKHHEQEIEKQKNKLNGLMSSTNNLLMTFQEQAKGVIFDLEKKTDVLADEAKTGISHINNIFQENTAQFKDEQRGENDKLIQNFNELQTSLHMLKNTLEKHENSINVLESDHKVTKTTLYKLEGSLVELKKNLFNSQRKPDETEKRIRRMEEGFTTQFARTLQNLKTTSLVLGVLLMASIAFSTFIFFSR